jgi:hypothetical protein
MFFLGADSDVGQRSPPKSSNTGGLSMLNQGSPPKSPNAGGLSMQVSPEACFEFIGGLGS